MHPPTHRGLGPQISRAKALWPELSRGPPTPGRGWVNTSRGISRQQFSACGGPKATLFDVLGTILNFPWFPHVVMALSRCARLSFAQVAHNFAGVPAGFFNPNQHQFCVSDLSSCTILSWLIISLLKSAVCGGFGFRSYGRNIEQNLATKTFRI